MVPEDLEDFYTRLTEITFSDRQAVCEAQTIVTVRAYGEYARAGIDGHDGYS